MSRFVGRLALFLRERKNRRLLIRTSGIIFTSSIIAYYWPEISFCGRTVRRAVRTAWHVGLISLDYKFNFPAVNHVSLPDKDEWRHKRSIVHYRAASRLLRLFQTNGGVYIKVGQHLSALEYILPPEYCNQMSILHSQAPKSSFSDVSLVFIEDLGESIRSVFSEFDPEPIGAASLAQVHRAILRDGGEEVAVKIQHLKLQSFVDSDMFVISCVVKVIKKIFPEFDFDWIADEMKTNLPKELDFISEAHNAERVTRNLRQFGFIPMDAPSGNIVKIPKIHWNHTSKRVLVMEYLPGVKATDKKYLLENEIEPQQVSDLITKIFSEMIFMHGFVHCDPHPGNLLIRPRQTKRHPWFFASIRPTNFELVLLDHGLYRELSSDFRHNYAGLWKAVIDASESEMRRYAELIGGGDAYRLFSCILTQRPWQSIVTGSILRPKSTAEVAEIIAKAPEYLSKVADLLAKVPRPLLLLLKTNDLLRHLERALMVDQAQPSRTFTIMARYCIDALYEDQFFSIKRYIQRWWYHLRISLLDCYLHINYLLSTT